MPKGIPKGTVADPVSCEALFPGSDYNAAEVIYLKAVDAYRRRVGRKFLLATEYLKIALELGYRQMARE